VPAEPRRDEASPDSLERLAAIVQSSDDAILSKDTQGVITSWNPGARRVYGYTEEQAVGQPVSILIPPHRSGEERRILDRVLAGEPVETYETERLTKDGRQIVVSLTVSPLRGPDGAVRGASAIAREVTDRHRTLTLAARLQALTSDLSKEITREPALDVLLEQAVSALGADAGAVGLVNPAGTEVELIGTRGHSEAGLSGWHRFPVAADLPMSLAIRTGEGVWTSTSDELAERFPALAGRGTRFASLAVIPLAIKEQALGAISLSFKRSRTFDDEERAFLTAAAQQAAHTFERARLYEAQRQTSERLSFLAEASELLARSLDPDETLRGLADLVVPRIADWCGIELLDEEGALRNVAVAHVDPERVKLADELRNRYPVDPDAETGVPNVIRTGRSELYAEIPDELLVEAAQDEEHLRIMRELGLVSVMIVPLLARGRAIGAVSFVAAESGIRYDERDLELAEDLARRAALAIDNAMLFKREHEAAVILQRSLLPESLPELVGIGLAARYEPAAPGLEVGGDWYEVVARDDGTVAVTIGDVAGRGVRAASVMGRVRPALRAVVAEGHPPEEAIRRLDALIKESDGPEMATVFHLHYDPEAQAGEYVRAGHPPALLRLPDGRVTDLDGRGVAPLGILDQDEFRPHAVEIPHGSLLLLYTDGLIERRGADLTAGLERLREVFSRSPAAPDACLAQIADEYRAEQIPDDVAMLAIATAR
jgi:PAS domain S-box-containing protein